jgi:hypothetical protein
MAFDQAPQEETSPWHGGGGEEELAAARQDAAHWLTADPARYPGASIGAEYIDADKVDPRGAQVIDVDSEAGRQATLNRMVQNVRGDEGSEHSCGPTSVLAGAMMAGGRDGLRTLINDVSSHDQNGHVDAETQRLLQAVNDPHHQLTQGDLNTIEGRMYASMRADQHARNGDESRDIEGEEVQRFIREDPELNRMFARSHQRIDLVDNDGERDHAGNLNPDHFVLERDDAQGHAQQIYDPWARFDGNQVITNQNVIRNYQAVTFETETADQAAAQAPAQPPAQPQHH